MLYRSLFGIMPAAVIFVSLLFHDLSAQDTLWTRTYGGTNIDVGYSVRQTNDNGYIITGYTRSFGTQSGRNVWLIKTDILGNIEWHKTYGGNSDDEGASVQPLTGGGYVMTGYTSSFGSGLKDLFITRTDTGGNELWSRYFGGSSDEEGYSIIELRGGGYLAAGATSSFGSGSRDGMLVKADVNGNEIWRKAIGGLSSDGFRSVQQTADGGFILTGWTFSSGPQAVGNAWLVKTDSLGNTEWSKAYGGTDADRGYSVLQTMDGGYIFTGYTASSGQGLDDMYVVKTDVSGNALWSKTYGGAGRDYGNSIAQDSDGGFIIAGYTLSYGAGGDDVWLIKIDSLGAMLWNKTYGGTASDVAYAVDVTRDGGCIITGHTLSRGAGVHDVWLLKTGSVVPVEFTSFAGTIEGDKVFLTWATASERNNYGFEIENRSGNKWDVIGFVNGAGTSALRNTYSFTYPLSDELSSYYRLKQIDLDGSYSYSDIIEIKREASGKDFEFEVYPNPMYTVMSLRFKFPPSYFSNNKSVHVKFSMYDVLGNEVYVFADESVSDREYIYRYDLRNLLMHSGVYFVHLTVDGYSFTKKIVLIR